MMRRSCSYPRPYPSNYERSGWGDEDGAVLILGTFLLIVLLALAGLAIDAGNLYKTRIRAQKAADAGALSGIGYTILQRNSFLTNATTPVLQKAWIEERAAEATRVNLLAAGIHAPPGNLGVRAEYEEIPTSGDSDLPTLTVTVGADIPLLLMDLVPLHLLGLSNVPDEMPVGAVAQVRRARANVSLILDVSSSMGCPEGADTDGTLCRL